MADTMADTKVATGLLSKGITFSKGVVGTGNTITYSEVPGLMECPEMGGSAEKVEVTTLADASKRYINGVVDYGDMTFKFLYDNSAETSSYRVMNTLKGVNPFKVEFPDGTSFEFTGTPTTKVDSASVNGALTFTVTIAPNSAITITNPTTTQSGT